MITRDMIGHNVNIVRADEVTVNKFVIFEANQFAEGGFKGFVTSVEAVGDDVIISGWKFIGTDSTGNFEVTTSEGNAVMVVVEP